MPSSYSNRICGDVNVVNADFSDDFFRWRASLSKQHTARAHAVHEQERESYMNVMMIDPPTLT